MINKITFLLILLACYTLCTPFTVHAGKLSLGVYPPLIKIKIVPGSQIQQPITLTNYGDSPTMISLELKPFTSSKKKNGEVIFSKSETELKDFFSNQVHVLDDGIQVSQLLLAPQEKKELILKVAIPKNYHAQDYYFSLLFITKANHKLKSNASFLSAGIATNVLLSVTSKEQQDSGYIKQFSTKTFTTEQTIPFTLELGNLTNHYITANPEISIRNIFSLSKEIIKLHPVNILGNDSRYVTNFQDLNDSLILWKKQPSIFGIYEADASVAFANNSHKFHKKIYFYSYSKSSLIIIFFVILFSGIVIFRILRKRA